MLKYQETLQLIQKELDKNNWDIEPKNLYQPIKYILDLGGKRIRPILVLYACDLFKGNINESIPTALGIELFHNFTLLHDDIMDKSPIRRGKPTVYKKWNTNIAILSGDAMFAIAYMYVNKTKPEHLPSVLDVFNDTALKVCEGQQYDMNFETEKNTSIEEYIHMIYLKTAVLIAASLKIGTLISGQKEDVANKMYQFGENLGIAFQLMDDYLDSFGDEKVFVKKTGNDILTNKKTYLLLKAYELANPMQKKSLNEAMNIADPTEKISAVTSIFKELEVDSFLMKDMDKYYQKANQIFDTIVADEDRKQEILQFVNNLVRRNH